MCFSTHTHTLLIMQAARVCSSERSHNYSQPKCLQLLVVLPRTSSSKPRQIRRISNARRTHALDFRTRRIISIICLRRFLMQATPRRRNGGIFSYSYSLKSPITFIQRKVNEAKKKHIGTTTSFRTIFFIPNSAAQRVSGTSALVRVMKIHSTQRTLARMCPHTSGTQFIRCVALLLFKLYTLQYSPRIECASTQAHK